MIKKCEVILRNDAVCVVDFDGVKVQMPAFKTNEKFVYIEFLDGVYSLSKKSNFDDMAKEKFQFEEVKTLKKKGKIL